jgi:nucleotide-binding universal stress UspA family protein
MLRLLLATDGSDNAMRAVGRVRALSENGLSVEVVLCNVQPGEALPASAQAPERRQREADANATMAPGIAELARGGVRVLTHHATGQAAEEIVRAALDWDAAAIVIGRRGAGTPASSMLGSVCAQVTREAQLPVMVVS